MKINEVDPNTLKGSFSDNLIGCRKYLLDEIKLLQTDFSTVYILGSWYGNLSLMLKEDKAFSIEKIINVDTDKTALVTGQEMADKMGYDNIEVMNKDANALDYRQLGSTGLVINQSVVNISTREWFDNIPANTMVAISARNNDPGAVTKFDELRDFVKSYPMKKILYSGKRIFTDPETKYDCYLLIGMK